MVSSSWEAILGSFRVVSGATKSPNNAEYEERKASPVGQMRGRGGEAVVSIDGGAEVRGGVLIAMPVPVRGA